MILVSWSQTLTREVTRRLTYNGWYVHHLTLFVKIVQLCRKGYETEVTKNGYTITDYIAQLV